MGNLIDKLGSIYTGWRQSFSWDALATDLKEAFEKRLATCELCPHMVEDWKWKLVNNFTAGKNQTVNEEYLAGMKCELCGCGTTRKISSQQEECPLPEPKWGKVIQDATGKVVDDGIPIQQAST